VRRFRIVAASAVVLMGWGLAPAPVPASDDLPSVTGEVDPVTVPRPYGLQVPAGYDEKRPTPLVVLLHGYSSDGRSQAAYFRFGALAEQETFLLATPDGTIDRLGNRFWNATDACCDFYGSGVDDVAFLDALVDGVSGRYNVDAQRVYLVGHSNGAFMAHRYACERPDRVAAIVTLAGMQWNDPARCATPAGQAPTPVSVLHVHGRADSVVGYEGGATARGAYPGARTTVGRWATPSGCTGGLTGTGQNLDLDTGVAGAETEVERYAGCGPIGIELWTIHGGSHVPAFNDTWAPSIWDFMSAHPKAAAP
jgi:polyhydroxybutyrate depolymerase